jgi:ATP-binding cassette, subfamily C (CFTR/MRP), member 1
MVRKYMRAFKEATRVESITNSPVLTHLGETIAGASTIRAFQKVDTFLDYHFKLQDINLNAVIIARAIQSWFNVRINMINQLFLLGSYSY